MSLFHQFSHDEHTVYHALLNRWNCHIVAVLLREIRVGHTGSLELLTLKYNVLCGENIGTQVHATITIGFQRGGDILLVIAEKHQHRKH